MRKKVVGFVKKQKLNNAGSALLTVIVVVAFITVLATTMLYISGMNFQMKQTDYQNKKSFYKAEEALDELKAELVSEDMTEAFKYAYQEVMIQYAALEGDARQAAFNGAFLDKLQEIWINRKTVSESTGGTLLDALKAMVPAYEKNFIAPEAGLGEADIALVCDRANGRFVVQNVRVRYAENGYSSFICTDIAYCVPDLDLEYSSSTSVSGTLPEREAVVLSDYIIFMNWKKY